MDIVADLTPDEITLLGTIVKEVRYGAGEMILREGDRADSIFLLAAGLVNVGLRLGDGTRQKRLGTIAPGVAFGELALLDGGLRSADVTAYEPSTCYVLPIRQLEQLARCRPEIQAKLLRNIGRDISARLRQADAEIRCLEE
jgi:glutaminase